METKEFTCHGGIGDADHGNEQPCPAGPCKATVKAGYDPCHCHLFGDDGEHIPNWEESCEGRVIAADTDVTEQVSSAAANILREAVEEPASTTAPMYEEYRGYYVPRVPNMEYFEAAIRRKGIDFVRVPDCSSIGIRCDGLTCDHCLFSGSNHDPGLLLSRHQWLSDNGYINEPMAEISRESTEECVSDPVVIDADDLEELSAPVEDVYQELGPNATQFDRYQALMIRDLDKAALCAWIALAALKKEKTK